MKIESYRQPKSSFLSMEKDLGQMADLFLRNQRLKKLLHYTTPDALSRNPLTDEETYALFGKQIQIIPKMTIDKDVVNQVIILFDDFQANPTNPQFRNNMINVHIICHFDQWHLNDFQLRPYKIAGEIDSMLDNQRFSGIGKLLFANATQVIYNNEFGGILLKYAAIHGEDDKKHMPNPADDEQFIADFNEMFNQ